MKTLIISLALFSQLTYATTNHEDFVHLTAHVGASYSINTVFYGVYSKAFRCERWQALLMSAVSTFMIGAVYKLSEQGVSDAEFNISMSRNVLGIGLSAGTVFLFQF